MVEDEACTRCCALFTWHPFLAFTPMNARIAHALNSQFGPPSEPIEIGRFVQDATNTIASTYTISEEFDEALIEECRQELGILFKLFVLMPLLQCRRYPQVNRGNMERHA